MQQKLVCTTVRYEANQKYIYNDDTHANFVVKHFLKQIKRR